MHHAYIYEGELSLLNNLAEDAKRRFDFASEHNPDVAVLQFEKWTIEEARQLRDLAQFKSVSGRALFVLGASSITSEAQQALLKLFEEPQKGSVFVLLLPFGTMTRTLRSRFLPYPAVIESEEKKVSVKTFLSSPYKNRSIEITSLLKDEDGARDRVRAFLTELESLLHATLSRAKKEEKKVLVEGLSDIARVRSYTNDRSPSLKMLLEHLAVSLPKI